jgi:hypothetical protein
LLLELLLRVQRPLQQVHLLVPLKLQSLHGDRDSLFLDLRLS